MKQRIILSLLLLSIFNPLNLNLPIYSKSIKLPKAEEYLISQEPNIYPRFIKAIVNPLDVKPGDIQRYEVILLDRADIKSVIAEIEIDDGKRILTLNKISEKSTPDNFKQFTFKGEWRVFGTHSKTYRTKITAQNSKAERNQVVLTWTDPCTPPKGGDWQVDGNCTFSSLNGVDNGNITGFLGPYTLTLNAPLVFNPGKSITINNGGKIAIGSGGSIKQGYLFVVDNDGDGRTPNMSTFYFSTNPTLAGYTRRYNFIADYQDCNDYNSNVWWYGYGEDLDGDNYAPGNIYDCQNGNYPYTATNGGDCNDNDYAVNPGASYYTFSGSNGWDYDCDGAITYQYNNIAEAAGICYCPPLYCQVSGSCYVNSIGWDGYVPNCGESNTFYPLYDPQGNNCQFLIYGENCFFIVPYAIELTQACK